jgi:hypothetical protein
LALEKLQQQKPRWKTVCRDSARSWPRWLLGLCPGKNEQLLLLEQDHERPARVLAYHRYLRDRQQRIVG